MNAINKLRLIYDGWRNLVFKDKDVEKLCKARAEICSNCEHLKCIAKMGGTVIYPYCEKCGCYISAKIRSRKEVCNEGKW